MFFTEIHLEKNKWVFIDMSRLREKGERKREKEKKRKKEKEKQEKREKKIKMSHSKILQLKRIEGLMRCCLILRYLSNFHFAR
jgi:hypothetical protein